MGRRVVATLLLWVTGFGLLRVSFLAPESCPGLSTGEALTAAAAAGDWLASGQDSEGRFLYEYDRESGRALPGYNMVRHAGVTMSLYQLAHAGIDDALTAADTALELMLDGLEPAGAGRALVEPGSRSARVGASALMAAALLDRRTVTADGRYDDELRSLGRFLVGQIGPDGKTSASYDLAEDAPTDETSRYTTGEAGWAVARLHTAFPGEGWGRPARLVADYLATERDEAEGMDFRPWPDQWAAYLLAELAPEGLSADHAAYARALAVRFGMLVRVESQKDGWPTPFLDPHARGAGLGVWVEGIGSLARVAAIDPRLADLRPALDERLACGAGLLTQRQVTAGPTREAGAWFRNGLTRMDDQQHALAGLLAAAGRFERAGS
jgi:hypothetical protein